MSLAEVNHFAADPKSSAAPGAENDKAQAEKQQATPLTRFIAFAASKVHGFSTKAARLRREPNDTAHGQVLTDAESADPADGWYAVGRGL